MDAPAQLYRKRSGHLDLSAHKAHMHARNPHMALDMQLKPAGGMRPFQSSGHLGNSAMSQMPQSAVECHAGSSQLA